MTFNTKEKAIIVCYILAPCWAIAGNFYPIFIYSGFATSIVASIIMTIAGK